MIIGIDLDDVLADFITAYTYLAHVRYGEPALGTLPVDWEWSNFGLTKEEQAKVWDDIKVTPHFWECLRLEDGATGEMLRALDKRHTLYYPTARVDTVGLTAAKQSANFLDRNFGIPHPTVIVGYEKGSLAAALKYDYFIDDRPKNCLDIQKAVPTCKVYLKDSSHNLAFDADANGLTRVKDFDTFAKIILNEEGKCAE
jgi:5'(3')-deoxyribonucleotidase